MTGIVLVSSTPGLIDRVGFATNGSALVLPGSPIPANADSLWQALAGAPKAHVVILDPGDAVEVALGLAGELDREHGVSVVLVSDRPEQIGYAAIRAGVKDIVSPRADVPELQRVLEHVGRIALDREAASLAQAQRQASTKPVGRVIAVVSPKGGVGKTTVATNLAVGIALRAPQQVVLVDLDIHFGDVASALNLTPEYSLPDTVRGPASRDPLALKSFLTLHESGLFVIPGSDSPIAADAVTATDVHNLLGMLTAEFPYVIVDTAPGLSEHTLAVLDRASELVLVTSLDVPGIRGLRKEIETLTDLGMLTTRHVVLNFTDDSRGLTVSDVRATIREDVDIVLPLSNLVPISVNQGIPLVQSGGKAPITKQLIRLVDRITGPVAPPQQHRLFARRNSRTEDGDRR